MYYDHYNFYNLIEDYKRALDKIQSLTFSGTSREISLCNEAKDLFVSWFNENEKLKFITNNDALDSMYGKLGNYLLRLSLVIELLTYSVSNDELRAISANSVKSAIRLVEYFRQTGELMLNELLAANDVNTLSPSEQKLLDALPSPFDMATAKKIAADTFKMEYATLKTNLSRIKKKGFLNHDGQGTAYFKIF